MTYTKAKLKIPMLEQDSIKKIIEPAQEPEALTALKQSVEANLDAEMICQSKESNPNFFSVIFANKEFYETFELDEFELIGKNYDFLFADLDLDYSSEDQLEYVRLIKAVNHRYFFFMGNRNTRKAGVYVKELCNAMWWVLQGQKKNGESVSLFNMSMNFFFLRE
jgi:hypothetical protein